MCNQFINLKGKKPSSQGLELKHRTPEQSEEVLRLELGREKIAWETS